MAECRLHHRVVLLWFVSLALLCPVAMARRGTKAELSWKAVSGVLTCLLPVIALWEHLVALQLGSSERISFRIVNVREIAASFCLPATPSEPFVSWLFPAGYFVSVLILSCIREVVIYVCTRFLSETTDSSALVPITAATMGGIAEPRATTPTPSGGHSGSSGSGSSQENVDFLTIGVALENCLWDAVSLCAVTFLWMNTSLVASISEAFYLVFEGPSSEDEVVLQLKGIWFVLIVSVSIFNLVLPGSLLMVASTRVRRVRLAQGVSLSSGNLKNSLERAMTLLVPLEPWIAWQLCLDALLVAGADFFVAASRRGPEGRWLALAWANVLLVLQLGVLVIPRWVLDARLLRLNVSLRVALLAALQLHSCVVEVLLRPPQADSSMDENAFVEALASGAGRTLGWPVLVLSLGIWSCYDYVGRQPAHQGKYSKSLRSAEWERQLTWQANRSVQQRKDIVELMAAKETEDETEPGPLALFARDLAHVALSLVMDPLEVQNLVVEPLSHDEKACVATAAELLSLRLDGLARVNAEREAEEVARALQNADLMFDERSEKARRRIAINELSQRLIQGTLEDSASSITTNKSNRSEHTEHTASSSAEKDIITPLPQYRQKAMTRTGSLDSQASKMSQASTASTSSGPLGVLKELELRNAKDLEEKHSLVVRGPTAKLAKMQSAYSDGVTTAPQGSAPPVRHDGTNSAPVSAYPFPDAWMEEEEQDTVTTNEVSAIRAPLPRGLQPALSNSSLGPAMGADPVAAGSTPVAAGSAQSQTGSLQTPVSPSQGGLSPSASSQRPPVPLASPAKRGNRHRTTAPSNSEFCIQLQSIKEASSSRSQTVSGGFPPQASSDLHLIGGIPDLVQSKDLVVTNADSLKAQIMTATHTSTSSTSGPPQQAAQPIIWQLLNVVPPRSLLRLWAATKRRAEASLPNMGPPSMAPVPRSPFSNGHLPVVAGKVKPKPLEFSETKRAGSSSSLEGSTASSIYGSGKPQPLLIGRLADDKDRHSSQSSTASSQGASSSGVGPRTLEHLQQRLQGYSLSGRDKERSWTGVSSARTDSVRGAEYSEYSMNSSCSADTFCLLRSAVTGAQHLPVAYNKGQNFGADQLQAELEALREENLRLRAESEAMIKLRAGHSEQQPPQKAVQRHSHQAPSVPQQQPAQQQQVGQRRQPSPSPSRQGSLGSFRQPSPQPEMSQVRSWTASSTAGTQATSSAGASSSKQQQHLSDRGLDVTTQGPRPRPRPHRLRGLPSAR
eukprot:TRINITY_DN59337_c0_g1_i2.p1 TRINITY_DN59337_c0_g1~~TRINITY_DN59337_c0_g1_i2.p1  ORF type:complete len:1246 (+),score=272.93 TRINITY_DN59337_c0_g1_i2:157-3894(+)